MKRRISCPGPAGVIHIIRLRRTENLQTTKLFERSYLLLHCIRDIILCQQFADGSLLSFGTGPVIAENVDHYRVVGLPETVQFIQNPSDLSIYIL